MKVGVTGTRNGFTALQFGSFTDLIERLQPSELHHGDCYGVDKESARFAYGIGIPIVNHPPKDARLRAYFPYFREIRPVKSFAERNRDIVNESDILLVCPKEMNWQPSGCTWMTHDFGKAKGMQVYIILPDGQVRNGAI